MSPGNLCVQIKCHNILENFYYYSLPASVANITFLFSNFVYLPIVTLSPGSLFQPTSLVVLCPPNSLESAAI